MPEPGVSRGRRWSGLALAGVGLPLLTAVLVQFRAGLTLETVLLLYLLGVVVVAVTGGLVPAVLAAVGGALLANYFFVPPFRTLDIESQDNLVALLVFVGVAVLVSLLVEVAGRLRSSEERTRSEALALSRVAATPAEAASLTDALEEVRRTYGMAGVRLVDPGDGHPVTLGAVGEPVAEPVMVTTTRDGLRLEASGQEVFAADESLLSAMADAAARTVETERLVDEARAARELAEIDRARAALLAAVGHDLRTPLAGIKAAVSSLRLPDVTLEPEEQAELLATIEASADRLDALVGNLLAMSRLQAGALSVDLRPTALDEVVALALLPHPGPLPWSDGAVPVVRVDVPDTLPLVVADPGLLERVLGNLVDNARRFSPAAGPGAAVEVTAQVVAAPAGDGAAGDAVALRVVDHGPGVAAEHWEAMFAPFQRLDDRSSGGTGLGLAIARGFTAAMGGRLEPSTTPGGGLTMTLTLPVAS